MNSSPFIRPEEIIAFQVSKIATAPYVVFIGDIAGKIQMEDARSRYHTGTQHRSIKRLRQIATSPFRSKAGIYSRIFSIRRLFAFLRPTQNYTIPRDWREIQMFQKGGSFQRIAPLCEMK